MAAALLSERSRELERHLPAAAAGEETAVHQARVASRRLREGLPVLAPPSGRARKSARQVRRITMALGAVREMDVTLKVLEELALKPSSEGEAIDELRRHVLAERDRRREAMGGALARVKGPKLARRLRTLEAAAADPAERRWRERLARRMARRAKIYLRALRAAGQVYSPHRLHEVRIATKKLRYVLELAADARVAGARRLVAPLKRSQDVLGHLNDRHVIQQHVAHAIAGLPAGRAAVIPALQRLSDAVEGECRHLHARFVKQLPALLALGATARSTIAPALREAAAPPASRGAAADTLDARPEPARRP